MSAPAFKPAKNLYRRCQFVTGCFLIIMLALTFGLWRASVVLLNFRLQEASRQNSRQAIERLEGFLQNRLIALREVSHFIAHSQTAQEGEFQGFCSAILADVPGILAILVTDVEGNPMSPAGAWIAPPNALALLAIYQMTADPKLKQALERSRNAMQPMLTETMDLPELGAGFMATTPIMVGNRHKGYIVGIFQYKGLLDYVQHPKLLSTFRVRIWHGGWPVFPLFPPVQYPPLAYVKNLEETSGANESFNLGGQEWVVSVEPLKKTDASPINFASLTILTLGLSLSFLLSILVYRWQMRALHFQAQARDSQKRLEHTGHSLAEVKSEMDLILNSVDEGVIFYNEHLEPVQANAAFLLAFHLNENSRMMKNSHDHHEHMIERLGSETKYWALFNALRNNPENSYADELETTQLGNGKDSLTIFLRRATTVCGLDGNPRSVLVIYKDVTRIKAMDKVKDEFLSNVTHELRSPLASIKGFAETIRRDSQMPTETREEFISIICEESERLQDLIEELLDLRRMEASGVPMRAVPYDLKLMIDDLIRSSRTILLPKNITTKNNWTGAYDSRLMGDVSQMNRALRNLLVNAVKYSPQGGEIAIHGHCGQKRVWLEITDQGSGIDERDLPRIFDKFYRGSRQGRQKGTGLGLAIVKHIVEQHGGHLGVRSEVGHGTAFRIELPRAFKPQVKQVSNPTEADTLDNTPAGAATVETQARETSAAK